MLLFIFIPVSLSTALVFSPTLGPGLFYSTAFALNWLIGAGTYFLLPSIGPFDTDPALFAELPNTAVSHLQDYLVNQRADFLADPTAAGAVQSIGAFASLHVSIFATAAMAAHMLALRGSLKVVLWTLTALTAASTIYFGWHYILDVVGGFGIAALALALAWALTGIDLRGARPRRPTSAAPEAA
jgi:membrane-associated phospholipid phosphatase